jgi:DNA-binding transcriptional LysR family regulator
MNIRWITLFATVAEEGSFTRAATMLNIAQPWLSAQIRKLEQELGVRLFERLSAGVKLTSEGEQLLPYAQQVAAGTQKFRSVGRTLGQSRAKMVRIGTTLPMMDVPALNTLNSRFLQRYPQYSIIGQTGVVTELLTRLADGEIDIAACIAPLPEEHQPDRFEIISLQAFTPYLLGSRSRIAKAAKTLQGQTIIIPQNAESIGAIQACADAARAQGASLRIASEVDKRAMEHEVRHRDELAIMIGGAAHDYQDDPELAASPLDDIQAEYVVVRLKRQSWGGAAERYWNLIGQ